MEHLLSAIMSDLMSRALSMVIQRYRRSKTEEAEHKLQRLQRVLLRVDSTVEEAEGRHITNQAMLWQIEMLRQGMYSGHYMLDTFRYKCHGVNDEVSGGRVVALTRFSSANRLLFSLVSTDKENLQNTMLDADSVRKLEKMLGVLEKLMGDMQEFIVFLEGYPSIRRQPYSTYLIVDKVMFGRQMEKETVINFLLHPEITGNGNPSVLPIVGAVRVGKSTLVEHICLDERVRGHFSLIVFFTEDDLRAGNMSTLEGSGVIKHRDLTAASHGRSLVVIQLDRDMAAETWRRLYSPAESSMGNGSKIIITSRSEKIVSLGTTQALRLKLLPQEAYWYFFKALSFGSTNPHNHPKLAYLGMEIAALLNGAFMGANVVASLLRANQNAKFWRRVLHCVRDYTSKHLLTFGDHPTNLLQKGRPVYIWRMARNQNVVEICNVYQKGSAQHAVPKLRSHDILTGRVTDEGKFCMVAWRSTVPPYNTYLASCVSKTVRCSMANKKRPGQARV